MSFLDGILAYKRLEIEAAKREVSLEELANRVDDFPPVRPFVASLLSAPFPAMIAEIKKRSPSKGEIRPDLDPVRAALEYAEAGAAGLSILTDEKNFGGSLDYISQIRRAGCNTPILRKDFIIDEYQIWESRAHGADSVLLITSAVDTDILIQLVNRSLALGLNILLETHSSAEIATALDIYMNLPSSLNKSYITIGINNRDLKTFNTSVQFGLDAFTWLREKYPSDILQKIPFVAESGIFTGGHIIDLYNAGATAFLIGESLIREGSPGINLRNLMADARALLKENTSSHIAN